MHNSASDLKYFEGPDTGFRLANALSEPTLPSREKYAVYLRLSSLDANNLRDYHIDTAKYAITTVCAGLRGNLYLFDSSDMVLLCPEADAVTVKSVTRRLRNLFAGLTTLLAGNDIDLICNWYDLSTQGAQFEDICRPLTGSVAKAASRFAPPASQQKNFEPINAEMLARLERGLSTIDVSSFIRRQPICKILPGLATQPKHLAHEIYVRVADLRNTILPDVDLLANRWLFRHLTARLDERVLSTILNNIQSNLRTPISLNMNLKSVMSRDFSQLVRLLSPSQREKIIIEIHCVDLMADPGAFLFAHSYLSNTGFRLALDGTDLFSFPEFARHDIGFHFVKVQWNEALERDLAPSELQTFEKAIAQLGAEKVILCHCGTPLSVAFGHKVGVNNFQGRHIDELLNPVARRQN